LSIGLRNAPPPADRRALPLQPEWRILMLERRVVGGDAAMIG
jgi:hypothetical protein